MAGNKNARRVWMAGYKPGDKPAPDASSPEAQLQKACRDVMGFYPGEVRFDVCMRSLKRSLQHYEQARAHSCMTEEVNSSAGHSAPCIVTSVKKTATTGRD